MAALAFDTLRYARRLIAAGVPEPQANAQAEIMAEAFGFYIDNLLTKDHFEAVLGARLAEQEARLDIRFVKNDAKLSDFEAQFAKIDASFERIDEKFARIDANFERMDEKFTRIDANFERIGEKFVGMESTFTTLDTRLEKTDTRFTTMGSRLTNIESKLTLHTWMLGLITVVLVVPQLQSWLT